MTTELVIRQPDDFHVHLRQGRDLPIALRETAKVFRHALVMPNLKPPILSWLDVCDYVLKIQDHVAEMGVEGFIPLMTIQITAATTPQVIRECAGPICVAGKLYPAGVTTNSENGVSDLSALDPVFAEMEKMGMVLCLHGELPGAFCLDRESGFLDDLERIATRFPRLRIVLEHLSTAEAVGAVSMLPDNVAATITAHHLVLTLDDVIGDMLRPHHFCKPVPKTPADREALLAAAISGGPKFFFGSDSAPHAQSAKECASGCAGVFSAPVALPVLATIFEQAGALDRLEGFVSGHGARFYGLSDKVYGLPDRGTITLRKETWKVPEKIGCFVPFFAGRTLVWSVAAP